MNFGKTYLVKSINILLIIMAIVGCSQKVTKGKIKIKAVYNFFDLYKSNLGGFNPGTGLKFTTFNVLDDRTVFLGGTKDLEDFYKKPGNSAVVFISKDMGKSYDEILFPEENVTSLTLSDKYSLVETNSNGYSPKGKNCIYLLDNTTFKYQKIDEFNSNSKINYTQFNGQFVIYSNDIEKNLLNIFTKEKYNLPDDVIEKNFILNKSGSDVIFLKNGNTIVKYNPLSDTYKIVKELKNSYSTIMDTFGAIYLGQDNLLKTSGTVYDLNEKKLFNLSPKTEEGIYRYKNFACVITQHMPKFTVKYSYDYGKTWQEYTNSDFIITSNPIGFYKDQYIVLDAGLYRKKNSDEAGKRIIIGEFKK